MNVAGDEEVETSVAVVVAPGGAGGPVAEGDAGFFGDVGKGSVVVVVVEAVLAEVGDVDIGPAVVVVVGDRGAESPAIVGDACFGGDVGEGSVVIVVEERGVGRRCLAGQRIVGGAVDEIDVQPAVVVVVDQADARANGFDDEVLLRSSYRCASTVVRPDFLGDVLKEDGAAFHEAASGDGPMLAIEDGCMGAAGIRCTHACGLALLWGTGWRWRAGAVDCATDMAAPMSRRAQREAMDEGEPR